MNIKFSDYVRNLDKTYLDRKAHIETGRMDAANDPALGQRQPSGAMPLDSGQLSLPGRTQTPDSKVGMAKPTSSKPVEGMGFDPYTRGMTDAEIRAHNQGLEWAARAEGEFSDFTNPSALRWTASKPFTQFKGFQFYILNDIFKPRVGDTPATFSARVAKKLGVVFATGGLKALASPGGTAAKAMVAYWAFNTIKNAAGWYKSQHPEATDEEATNRATQIVNSIVYGFPGLIGLDLSPSAALLDFYGKNPSEKIVGFFGGPFLASIVGMGEALTHIAQGKDAGQELGKVATKQFSLVKSGAQLKGLAEPKKGIENKLDNPNAATRPSLMDEAARSNVSENEIFMGVMQAMGFMPIKEAKKWDKVGSSGINNKMKSQIKSKL